MAHTKSSSSNSKQYTITNIAEIGTLSMEFNYLSDITGDQKYADKIRNIQKIVEKYNIKGDHKCSFPLYWNVETGVPVSSYTSLGAGGDSFFEYLIKEWRRSGHQDIKARDMFQKAIKELDSQVIKKTADGLTFVKTHKENSMEHLACFSGGMYGLAGYDAKIIPNTQV